MLLDGARTVVLSCVTLIILTLFLLSGGPPMLARMTAAFASDLKSAHILAVIEKVRSEVGRFYVTTALINVGLGIATSLVMMACGMPNPFLWGTMAAVLNFIPNAGATTTLIVVTLVAIISFDGLGHAIAVAGSYLALATIEGQFVQPLLVGRRLRLNPMLVFLALWFGGFFWGIPGIILATPALAALKVVAENSAGGKQLLEFLSPHKEDEPADKAFVEPEVSLAVALRQREAPAASGVSVIEWRGERLISRIRCIPERLRQRIRQRGDCRCPAGRPQLPAALCFRPVCRAVFRHGLHGAARGQSPLLAVPYSARSDPQAFRALRASSARSRIERRSQPSQSAAMGSAACSCATHRLYRRTRPDGRQRVAGRPRRLPSYFCSRPTA